MDLENSIAPGKKESRDDLVLSGFNSLKSRIILKGVGNWDRTGKRILL